MILFSLFWLTSPTWAESHPAARTATINELKRQQFFRRATCREITDAFLKDNGLPPIARNSAVNGRVAFDRSGARDEVPTLKDELKRGPMTFTISAKPEEGDRWVMSVTRAQQGVRMESSFDFHVVSSATPIRCESAEVSFSSKTGGDPTFNLKHVTPDACLDVFLKKASNQTRDGWVRKDCATLLRFVAEPSDLIPPTEKSN